MKISKHQSAPPPVEHPTQQANNNKEFSGSKEKTLSNSQTNYVQADNPSTDPLPAEISDVELQTLISDLGGSNDVDGGASTEAGGTLDPKEFFEFMKGLDEPGRQEMHSFHRQIMEAARDGGLDESKLASLVEQSPQALQDFADSKGISVEDLIGQIATHKPPRRPSSALQSEMMEFFKSQGLNPKESGMGEFFRELMETTKNGGDVNSLASDAPQAFQDFAEHKGISLTDLLGQMVADIQSHGPQGPGPNRSRQE